MAGPLLSENSGSFYARAPKKSGHSEEGFVSKLKILRWLGVVCFISSAAIVPVFAESSMELSTDGCTLYRASAARIDRYDLCGNQALAAWTSLPDARGALQMRALQDGGLLVANFSVIARFDADGTLTRTYDLPDHDCWSGIALDKDDTGFLASSSCGQSVARFGLNARSPAHFRWRMFGGGTTYMSTGVQVNHGIELYCTPSIVGFLLPNRLQVVWGGSNVFYMERMTSVSCSGTPFNTMNGTGAGTINGQQGATVQWTFVDNGQPGAYRDTARLVIRDAAGAVVVEVSGRIAAGTHIATEGEY
jgi:hypothetical protein